LINSTEEEDKERN